MNHPRTDNRIPLARRGEDAAADHYARRGAIILKRNYRTRRGEIDLIVQLKGVVVAVEVKTRTSRDGISFGFGRPADAVDRRKVDRIGDVLTEYCAGLQDKDSPMRVDVTEVVVRASGEIASVRVIENVTQ